MKKTKEYIKKFKLDKANCDKTFNSEAFIAELLEEFNERLNISLSACNKMQVDFNYSKFQQIVKEMNNKFKAISAKKMGLELDEGIFSKFYAMGVIPVRARMFPKEHAEATMAREKKLGLGIKEISLHNRE